MGGLLRFRIPDFKLDKSVVKKKSRLNESRRIEFKTNTLVGKDYSAEQLKREFHAIVLAMGSTVPEEIYLSQIVMQKAFILQWNIFVKTTKK